MTSPTAAAADVNVPIHTTDEINAKILAVSEDRIPGFQTDPLGEIARQSGVELPVVIERIRAMLQAGPIPPQRHQPHSLTLRARRSVARGGPHHQLCPACALLCC